MKKSLENLVIAIPTKQYVHVHLASLLCEWSKQGAGIMTATITLIDHARNSIVREFLKTDREWLLMIDADVIPPLNGPQSLIKKKKEIISGYYRLLLKDGSEGGQPQVCSCAYGVEENAQGLRECDRLATGYLLMNRKLFDKVKEPWFEFAWDDKHRIYLSEDWVFTDKCKEQGIELWCDLDNRAKHAKTILLE